MRHLPSTRLPAVLAAGALLAAAAPAAASEDPIHPPPPNVPALHEGLTPVRIPPLPASTLKKRHRRPVIRHARIVPRRVRARRQARVRLTLSTRGRLVIAITRVSRPHRGRVTLRRVRAHSRHLGVRLRRRHHRALAPGRYRVTVVLSAHGRTSRPVRRHLVVRPVR